MAWGEDDDERLLELHAQGLGCSAIAREMGVNAGIVSVHAQRLGVRWNQARKAMNEGRREEARTKRLHLRENLMNDAARLQEQMFSQSTVFNFGGKDNTFAQETLPQPPTADQLKIAQAIKTLVESVEKLDKMDADADMSEDIGILDELFAAMQVDQDMEDLL